MNILIVGYGFAGNQYFRALDVLKQTSERLNDVAVAYYDKKDKNSFVPYFADLNQALSQFRPDLIIVTVNDAFHADILNELSSFKGFVICEKPLANSSDNLEAIKENLKNIRGFYFNLIERYSQATQTLRAFIERNQLELVRAHFTWAKNRLNDYRPTVGVTSEIIHSLDLIQYVCPVEANYELHQVIGSCSDFSVSGADILDSLSITAKLNQAVVTGYSSFVNISRTREINFIFHNPMQDIIYARMIFDTPEWDEDTLCIWKHTANGEHIFEKLLTEKKHYPHGKQAINKFVYMLGDIINLIHGDIKPKVNLPDLQTALTLQVLLNEIERKAIVLEPIEFFPKKERQFLFTENDLEKLG